MKTLEQVLWNSSESKASMNPGDDTNSGWVMQVTCITMCCVYGGDPGDGPIDAWCGYNRGGGYSPRCY